MCRKYSLYNVYGVLRILKDCAPPHAYSAYAVLIPLARLPLAALRPPGPGYRWSPVRWMEGRMDGWMDESRAGSSVLHTITRNSTMVRIHGMSEEIDIVLCGPEVR